eukprot:3754450-Rhodomonas_salina.1
MAITVRYPPTRLLPDVRYSHRVWKLLSAYAPAMRCAVMTQRIGAAISLFAIPGTDVTYATTPGERRPFRVGQGRERTARYRRLRTPYAISGTDLRTRLHQA